VKLLIAAIVGLALVLLLYIYLARPPQLGNEEEVFQAVDALFTAMTAQDEKLLTQCEQRLRLHRETGKLPPGPAAYLDGLISRARSGNWQSAAHGLYAFMLAQRRESGSRPSPESAGAVRPRRSNTAKPVTRGKNS
jgi:hypothetical protein